MHIQLFANIQKNNAKFINISVSVPKAKNYIEKKLKQNKTKAKTKKSNQTTNLLFVIDSIEQNQYSIQQNINPNQTQQQNKQIFKNKLIKMSFYKTNKKNGKRGSRRKREREREKEKKRKEKEK